MLLSLDIFLNSLDLFDFSPVDVLLDCVFDFSDLILVIFLEVFRLPLNCWIDFLYFFKRLIFFDFFGKDSSF